MKEKKGWPNEPFAELEVGPTQFLAYIKCLTWPLAKSCEA